MFGKHRVAFCARSGKKSGNVGDQILCIVLSRSLSSAAAARCAVRFHAEFVGMFPAIVARSGQLSIDDRRQLKTFAAACRPIVTELACVSSASLLETLFEDLHAFSAHSGTQCSSPTDTPISSRASGSFPYPGGFGGGNSAASSETVSTMLRMREKPEREGGPQTKLPTDCRNSPSPPTARPVSTASTSSAMLWMRDNSDRESAPASRPSPTPSTSSARPESLSFKSSFLARRLPSHSSTLTSAGSFPHPGGNSANVNTPRDHPLSSNGVLSPVTVASRTSSSAADNFCGGDLHDPEKGLPQSMFIVHYSAPLFRSRTDCTSDGILFRQFGGELDSRKKSTDNPRVKLAAKGEEALNFGRSSLSAVDKRKQFEDAPLEAVLPRTTPRDAFDAADQESSDCVGQCFSSLYRSLCCRGCRDANTPWNSNRNQIRLSSARARSPQLFRHFEAMPSNARESLRFKSHSLDVEQSLTALLDAADELCDAVYPAMGDKASSDQPNSTNGISSGIRGVGERRFSCISLRYVEGTVCSRGGPPKSMFKMRGNDTTPHLEASGVSTTIIHCGNDTFLGFDSKHRRSRASAVPSSLLIPIRTPKPPPTPLLASECLERLRSRQDETLCDLQQLVSFSVSLDHRRQPADVSTTKNIRQLN